MLILLNSGFHLLGLERHGAIRLATCTGSMYMAMFTEKGQHSVEESYNYVGILVYL